MKKILRIIMLLVVGVALAAPCAEAQRHQGANNGGDRSRREQPGQSSGHSRNQGSAVRGGNSNSALKRNERFDKNRPVKAVQNVKKEPSSGGRPSVGTGNNSRPGNNGNHRPGNNGNHRPGQGVGRPGNNGNHRPGHGIDRPGNNGNHRPGHGIDRPGNNGGHHGYKPAHRPPHRPPVVRPPHRPHRPPMVRPAYRPVPPPAWRPRRGLPIVRGILGLTFGAAINVSLDYLYNNGYTVDGYGNDIVYLRNVPALNYIWTDAALYYGRGGLDASSFYYSTPYYDVARYNNVYNVLVNTYGIPVATGNAGGVMTSTWFGGNNGYITLSFGSADGGRFLTTLTMGM
ncbi:MAG: hypothetical protein K2L91_01570 [Duncaniella sp.]|nr:hypothetical protein [Duncaniella sp.]